MELPGFIGSGVIVSCIATPFDGRVRVRALTLENDDLILQDANLLHEGIDLCSNLGCQNTSPAFRRQ